MSEVPQQPLEPQAGPPMPPAGQPPFAVPPQPGPVPPAGYAPYAGYPQNAGYPGYPQNPGYPYPVMPAPQKNGLALTGMILGIVGLCVSMVVFFGGVVGIVGLVFSIIGMRAVASRGGAGRGMAVAGLVTSILAVLVNVVMVILFFAVIGDTVNCAQQYDPQTQQSQYQQCMDRNVIGN